MSFREEGENERSDLRKPFLHTGSWYRMGMGSRQSSLMGSSQAIRDSSISVLACVLIVSLGPIQFGFTDTSFLYMGRLLEGFGVGIISYTVPVYIAEIAPQNLRGGLGSVNQLSVTIGIMLSYLLGLFVDWRLLAVLGILPCLILIPGLFFIPESPRWLAKMGMTEDFEASLQVLRGFETDITFEVNEIKTILQQWPNSHFRSQNFCFTEICGLDKPKNGNPVRGFQIEKILATTNVIVAMIGIGLLILQQLSGINGVIFYSNNIFESAGITSSHAATVGVGTIQVIATAVATWLVDKTGRRILLIVSSSGMAVSLLLVAVSFFAKGFVAVESKLFGILGILSVVGVVLMIVFFSLGMGPIPWLIMSEILPIKIKGLAGSVATLFNWSCSWVITMTAPLLLTWSSGGTFALYSVMCILTAAFVTIWLPETKGRTLEEIQSSFR
ncbi:major facilitator superfamily protein [Striga asiatica]|uniref:Major facilitator superfamily protein n=1 Tax=Striga asiatica TaxID=4170 RepID=A0A5A7QMW0_STRAF|nr:major facilitator superfamily protein [Striga asiatica]